MRRLPPRLSAVASSWWTSALLIAAAGCAGTGGGSGGPGQGGSPTSGNGGMQAGGRGGAAGAGAGGTGSASGSGGSTGCTGKACDIVACPTGSPTTVTGTVYAPDGKLPLYNALVYVPNDPVGPIPSGLSCDRCGGLPPGAASKPIGAALTDANGNFRLENFPATTNVPIVIQIGKWRRQIIVPQATACQTTALTDPEQTRLPRNRSEGDMPRIAITTGTCDVLTCLLAKIGIDPSEFGIEGEDKAVIFYGGIELGQDPYFTARYDAHLQKMTSARDLWRDVNTLKMFDMVVASCECTLVTENKGPAAYQAMTDYLGMGGRLFATDRQYIWYSMSPDPMLSGAAQYQTDQFSMGASPVNLDVSFPKGKALADWLAVVNPGRPYGQMNSDPTQTYDNFVSITQPPWQSWGTSPNSIDASTVHSRILSINLPAGSAASAQCGKAVHIDPHVTPLDRPLDARFPTADACGTDLADGEKVLAFFLFDVAACIQEDWKPVPQPPVVK
jgi:hypothetical protein